MLKNVTDRIKTILTRAIGGKRGNNDEGQMDLVQLKRYMKLNPQTILIDVRSPQEYKEGHMSGSINIPLYELENKADKIIPNKKTPIILYCKSGARSDEGRKKLKQNGYEVVYSLKGGLDAN